MSDDSTGEKNQQATPKKLEDSRKEGQVSQSEDLAKLFILLAISEFTLYFAPGNTERLKDLVRYPLGQLHDPFSRALLDVVVNSVSVAAWFLFLTIVIAMVVRLASTWLQIGVLFAPKAIKPDIKRLNPVDNLKQRFSGQSFATLFLNLVKLILIASCLYIIVMPALGDLVVMAYGDINGYWYGLMRVFRFLLYSTFGVLVVLTMVDFSTQRYFFSKRMRMSFNDLKKEGKETQGNPEIKFAQRERAMELLAETEAAPGPSTVEDADMLVVNPTHVAVALYYRPQETPLPRLLEKGEDSDALELIKRAKKAEVPVLQCIRIARAIYPVNTGEYIPRESIQGVAQLYGILRELDDSLKDEIVVVP
ncbi:unnamed protein product [Ectocarpus sp. 12 AP-2014]